jgi:uncharacterized repeat protein (TIGR04076 family)
MEFSTCKITVVRRSIDHELNNEYLASPEHMKVCDQVDDHQEFFVENPYIMPAGICPWAWADLRPAITALAAGSRSPFMKNEHATLALCSDPFRPVTFLIERVD